VRSPAKPEAAVETLEVVAGGLFDLDGRVLIAQRPHGKSLAGRWEFPGGKLAPGEDPYAGLVRELCEELGVEVRAAHRLMRYPHAYPERTVWLDMWIVTEWTGTPQSQDGQAFAWVEPRRLDEHDILEADRPIVEALQGPMPR
jgi:8-oxo-dGTP diphosphatase